jgi:type VI secretion system (T6SS) immunity protein Tdi1
VAQALVAEVFPEFVGSARPFAYDWLGRQFAHDRDRVVEGEALVLLLEPGTGAALEIPMSFARFHEEELVNDAEATLAQSFFEEWSASAGARLPVGRNECVGYRIPLFLGGTDTIDNLEMVDIDVYWSRVVSCGTGRCSLRKENQSATYRYATHATIGPRRQGEWVSQRSVAVLSVCLMT